LGGALQINKGLRNGKHGDLKMQECQPDLFPELNLSDIDPFIFPIFACAKYAVY
jgi:hypothetical protein